MYRKKLTVPVELEKQIIHYYKDGYSQKDIQKILKISFPRIRNVLLNNGFNTCSYRAISAEIKSIIQLLICEKYSYPFIARVLDISFHVIRDLNEDNLNDVFKEYITLDTAEHISGFDEFLSEYQKGFSFLYLYEKLAVELQDVKTLVKIIAEDEHLLATHEKCLQERIIALLKQDCPINAIAKQLHISVSIVKAVNKEMLT